MISFIIIGRNEGWKLTKCLKSVCETIKYNNLKHYEVIYVDSKSTDDSIERAQKFQPIKIFKLTGDCNAAIARNVGAKESKGDVLFFIDGDMELQTDFLSKVYTEQNGLIREFVSGNWMNYYYDKSGKYLLKEPYKIMQKDAVESVTGGLFLIKADVWSKVNGMNPIFKKSQDIDLGLRLAKKGYYLLRKKEIAAIHHTKAYLDKSRAWKDLFSWNHLYARSLLYRQHVFNKHMYHRLLRNDYSMLILFLTLLFSLFFPNKWMFIIIPYFLILLLKTLRKRGNNNMYFKSIFHFLRDLTALFGLFIFWPKDKFINKYSKC